MTKAPPKGQVDTAPATEDPPLRSTARSTRDTAQVATTHGSTKWPTSNQPTPGRPSTPDTGKSTAEKDNESSNETTATSRTGDQANGTESHGRRVSSTTGVQASSSPTTVKTGVSEWSHQQLVVHADEDEANKVPEPEWQTMPAYAPFDIYDDDGKLIAKEHVEEDAPPPGYGALGGPAKGYTRVTDDDDAQSATSMDENTAYLFKEPTTHLDEEDEDTRDVLSQMQMTKELLTDNQRIAYVGIVKLATAEMSTQMANIERTRGSKKQLDLAIESLQLWGQKMMVRLYGHMELEAAEQVMIEQLAEHGLQAKDLTPSLMESSKVKNPAKEQDSTDDVKSPVPASKISNSERPSMESQLSKDDPARPETPPPAYLEDAAEDKVPHVQDGSDLLRKEDLDIDLRWTVLCDLFLILISDSNYDARSRVLLERVAEYLDVSWVDVCRFEKRVTEALEMEEEAQREELNEERNMEKRRKRARNRRLAMMGLATVGGGLVIGLSAGLMAPLIGAGLAAGFTTIGVTGTSGFLAGAGGAAIIGTAGTVTGGSIGVRAANRRTGSVRTFEYRPLHNNKRVNLILTVAGWMNGKVDDVRLPYSTVDPLMGDVFSLLWEPEMLRSMGDTIRILGTEALTQGLQQLLGSTILIALMAALQVPIVLSKLSYLIDNPWSVSVARADAAGLILADSLIERNLGARPITLVGFSLGSRVIFSALKELAKKGALGLIQNVYVFGTPVVVKKDDYLRARTVVSGRFVNGYATNDWILGYLFRATGGGIMRVAGLAKVEVPGIENFDATSFVPGHMAYRTSMPKLLRELGWSVTSDEFSEIEDPDPDNHEKRQRELINEIEEARKELEKAPEKRRFGIFSRNKKRAVKKNWEMYDEASKQAPEGNVDPNGALFDVNAIRREAVELAAEGIDVKQLESTMPPMKIDSSALSPTNSGPASKPTTPGIPAAATEGQVARVDGHTQPTSKINGLGIRTAPRQQESHDSYFAARDEARSPSDQLQYEEEDITMSFEVNGSRPPSLPPKPVAGPSVPSRSPSPERAGNGRAKMPERFGSSPNLTTTPAMASTSSLSLPPPKPCNHTRTPSPSGPRLLPHRSGSHSRNDSKEVPSYSAYRPSTAPSTAPSINVDQNPWADDEDGDLGKEREMSMTFE